MKLLLSTYDYYYLLLETIKVLANYCCLIRILETIKLCANKWLFIRNRVHVNKFTYLGSSISSTENDIDTWLAKAWTAIDSLSIKWKSDLSDKLKSSFFSEQQSHQYCCMDAPHRYWQDVRRESLIAIAQELCKLYWTSPGSSIPQNSSSTGANHPSRKPSKLDEQDMWDTAGEVRTNS